MNGYDELISYCLRHRLSRPSHMTLNGRPVEFKPHLRDTMRYSFRCNDYSGPHCPPIYAWTDHAVIMVREYDGYTKLTHVPRNPTHCKPEYV